MKAQSKLLLLLTIVFATTACGKVSGTIGGKKPKGVIPKIFSKGAGSEIVSSSEQATTTVGGYRVQSSAGSTLDKLQATTSGGYKVQMTVQGVILE